MLISLTLRFIPTLISETRKIMNAQASRGVDFNEGNLKDKINQIISLLVPMFVISFKRAEDLSNAMEARCYNGGEGRTKMRPLKYSSLDQRAYICVAMYIIVFYAVKVVL
jgi:energy-coupling factor transport system permease protein